MLFKTIDASGTGLTPILLERRSTSARMQDFSVLGLPDPAVKESRERHQIRRA
jgi:hypothetical protein